MGLAIRVTTPIPKSTHKNTGVRVIVAVKLKTKVTRPKIMLAPTEYKIQLFVHLHWQFDI